MIELVDLRYVHLGASNANDASKWAQEIYGLEEVSRQNGRIYLRGDDRDHNICYFDGDPKDNTVGIEVADYNALDQAASHLGSNGVEITWGDDEGAAVRRCMKISRSLIRPVINLIWWYVLLIWGDVISSRDAGVHWFNHIGLKTTDAPRDENFWCTLFNFQANDWIGDAPLMSFDKVHHRFALFPTNEAGVQHINFQVRETDDLMRSSYFLNERQIRIVFGPGRHATSGARFLYFEGPDGMVYEYSCGVKIIEPEDEWRPRQFPFTPESFCVWGSKPDIPEFRE